MFVILFMINRFMLYITYVIMIMDYWYVSTIAILVEYNIVLTLATSPTPQGVCRIISLKELSL